VVQTISVVGYAADGLAGAIVAAIVAFAPTFWFIALGAARFDRLRTDPSPLAFLEGAGPAAIGGILGAAVPLALALTETWQIAILAGGAMALLWWRRSVVLVILGAAIAGVGATLLGAPLST
jgi:chromate transporter